MKKVILGVCTLSFLLSCSSPQVQREGGSYYLSFADTEALYEPETEEEPAEAYQKIIESDISILESDYPVELGVTLLMTTNN